jgi:probable rRNA maturation factor
MAIQFFFLEQSVTLTDRTALKQFIRGIFSQEGIHLKSLNYIFCSDDYLLNINNTHLKHNFYTDIITFNLSETTREMEAEIYISIDRVKDNAAELGLTIKEELHRVIFHGVLHLCGYKDKTKIDQKDIRTAEDKYLRQYFG